MRSYASARTRVNVASERFFECHLAKYSLDSNMVLECLAEKCLFKRIDIKKINEHIKTRKDDALHALYAISLIICQVCEKILKTL